VWSSRLRPRETHGHSSPDFRGSEGEPRQEGDSPRGPGSKGKEKSLDVLEAETGRTSVKRHVDNFEGAFPLLLIGSVLILYAGILASQEIGTKTTHLPLWGLLGGVGAVIVGAGIYSTFLVTSGSEGPRSREDWVTVPRSEWEGRQDRRRVPEADSSREEPIWWEGPPARPDIPSSRSTRAPRPPSLPGVRAVPGAPAGVVSPTEAPKGPTPAARRRYSLQELRRTLDELEALESDTPKSPSRRSNRPWATGPLDCADCDRRFADGARPVRCVGCGRGLCSKCAASSRSEDGDLRCNDCRAVAT